MKTPVVLSSTLRLSLVFALILFISSCQRSEKMQTFSDVFDISGIEALNAQTGTAKTVADLPVDIGKATFAVPEGIADITPGAMAAWYKKNSILSDAEVDMLLKNDSKTYIDVLNRMANFPPEMGNPDADDFKALKGSNLNRFLLKQIEEPENFYSTDYYSAIVALQVYIKAAVIDPMEMVDKVKGEENVPSAIAYYKLIASNNLFDMWWTYYTDSKRTKHKGAAGSFPGN